jgi:hypothetical protein
MTIIKKLLFCIILVTKVSRREILEIRFFFNFLGLSQAKLFEVKSGTVQNIFFSRFFLRDDGELGAEVPEAELESLHPVHEDRTGGLGQSEQGRHQAGLPGPRAAHNAHLLVAARLEGEAAKDGRLVLRVGEADLAKFDDAVARPGGRRHGGVGGRGLLVEAAILQHSLHGGHEVLDLGGLADAPLEHPGEGDAGGDGEAYLTSNHFLVKKK